MREGTGHSREGMGSGWVGGLGKMKIISAGPQVVSSSHYTIDNHAELISLSGVSTELMKCLSELDCLRKILKVKNGLK